MAANPIEVLEFLLQIEAEDPLDLTRLGAYEPLMRGDVVVSLCEQLNRLSAELPDPAAREPVLLAMVARLVMENLLFHVRDLEEARAGEAAREFLARYRD